MDRLLRMADRGSTKLFAPLVRGLKGSHRTLLQLLAGEFGPEALLPIVIAATTLGKLNFNPLIFAEPLIRWTIPVIYWIKPYPLPILSNTRRANYLAIPA